MISKSQKKLDALNESREKYIELQKEFYGQHPKECVAYLESCKIVLIHEVKRSVFFLIAPFVVWMIFYYGFHDVPKAVVLTLLGVLFFFSNLISLNIALSQYQIVLFFSKNARTEKEEK